MVWVCILQVPVEYSIGDQSMVMTSDDGIGISASQLSSKFLRLRSRRWFPSQALWALVHWVFKYEPTAYQMIDSFQLCCSWEWKLSWEGVDWRQFTWDFDYIIFMFKTNSTNSAKAGSSTQRLFMGHKFFLLISCWAFILNMDSWIHFEYVNNRYVKINSTMLETIIM